MDIRFVTKDLEWNEAMKACVRAKIAEPLARHMKTNDFNLSVHFSTSTRRLDLREMWVVLETSDGRVNEIVRSEGAEFHVLTNDVSSSLRARLRKKSIANKTKVFINPFRFLRSESFRRREH